MARTWNRKEPMMTPMMNLLAALTTSQGLFLLLLQALEA